MKRFEKNQKTKKTIIKSIIRTVIMALTLTTLLTACAGNEAREAKAKELLSEKYGKQFEISEIYRQGLTLPYFEAWAYDTENPDLVFSVTVDLEGEGFSDTYVQKCVCSKISDSVSMHLDDFPGTFFVNTETQGMQPYADNPNIDVKGYWELNSDNQFVISVFSVPETSDIRMVYQSLNDILSDISYLDAKVNFYIVDNESLQKVQDYFETYDKSYMDFEKEALKYAQVQLTYQNGTLITSADEFEKEVGAAL